MPSELLKNLMEKAEKRRLVLPDFQRDFVWKPPSVIKLLASIFNGYPISGFLFMENAGLYGCRLITGKSLTETTRNEEVGNEKSKDQPADSTLILDGQQRLTSCYRAFYDSMDVESYPGRYYFKYYQYIENPNIQNYEVEDLIIFINKKYVHKQLDGTSQEQSKGLFPLDIIFQIPRGTDYSKWLSDYAFDKSKGSREEYDRLSQLQSDFIRRFIERVTSYQVHYEEIKKETSSDVICTVFETINTTGKQLTVFDLLVARCYPYNIRLRDMLEKALENVAIKNFDPTGELFCATALPRIIALKEKETARKGDILELDPEIIRNHWDYAVNALAKTLQMMSSKFGCLGKRFIPLLDIIAPMALIITSEKFKETDKDFVKLNKWYWRSVFSQYYVSSSETKIARTVKQWLKDGGWLDIDTNEPDSVKDFVFQDTLLEDVWRVDNAIYKGVLSLILSTEVNDFGKEHTLLANSDWTEIEDHHIYPKQFLASYGIKGDLANNIANRTPILSATNKAIKNNAPHVYVFESAIVGDQESLASVIQRHLIDFSIIKTEFSQEVYKHFIKDRTEKVLFEIGKKVEAKPISEMRD